MLHYSGMASTYSKILNFTCANPSSYISIKIKYNHLFKRLKRIKIIIPVLKAALTKPFLNASFNLGFIEKFKAPPVTDIKSFGASNFQQENNNLIILSMDVLWSTLINLKKKQK